MAERGDFSFSGATNGVGGGRGVGEHKTGLHVETLPRAHTRAPAGRRHRAVCQQNVG